MPSYYPALRYGGPIRSVHVQAAAVVQLGHEVHVYTTNMDGPGDLDVPIGTPVYLDGVAVTYFRVPHYRRLFVAPELARRLERTIADFDVVHVHAVFLWPTWAAARIAARARVPYIMTPHGTLMRELIRRKSWLAKSAWMALIERKSMARAAAVQVTAQLEAREIDALGFKVARHVNIPCGVRRPAQYSRLADGPYAHLPPRFALFLSRINWKKGLDRLIQAWQWTPEIPLIIAGNDEEGYQPQLEALVRQLGLGKRVMFLGPVRDEHKWALYEAAEIFLLPSYSENFGIVVAEAMAMGCPVVVTPEVGAGELVQEASAGIITCNEPRQLAAAVRKMLADRGALQRYGERGREFVRERLSWEGIGLKTCAMYREVL